MTLSDRINAVLELGVRLSQNSDQLQSLKQRASLLNPWFTIKNIDKSIQAIVHSFLNEEKLISWTSKYEITDDSIKNIGMVMAGNIPLVGFHDFLCSFISGHHSLIKLSDKDNILLPYLMDELKDISSSTESYFSVVQRLENFDAVLATGSNNTSTYFKKYFGAYPHIIRKSRNSVGILGGSESKEELALLGEDIFSYFGLGCRNVSKIYIPKNYDLSNILEELHKFNDIIHHHKYKNNYDYNMALFLLNKIDFRNNGSIILREEESFASRIAACHYEFYNDVDEVINDLKDNSSKIQCITSNLPNLGIDHVALGEAQKPGLSDYSDGVDTMQFLTSLN